MIELVPAERDDVAFLSFVQRIVNGAITALHIREVYLVHVDNWFDHKWLGWWSRKNEQELRLPLFNPNRIRAQKHFIWNTERSDWTATGPEELLHMRQAGRAWLAPRLDRFSKRAAFIWYSGNTAANTAGSLMFYLSGANRYSWYASFEKDGHWQIHDECQITRRELQSFEERGGGGQ